MDCKSFREQHVAFVDGALQDAELVAMQLHVEECVACAHHDAMVRRGLLVARNLPTLDVSPDFASRLNARLRELRAQDRAALAYRGPGWGSFFATAAGVVMVGVVATAALEYGRVTPEVALEPVLATRPALPPQPIVDHTYMLSASAAIPVWTAAMLADQAPQQMLTHAVAFTR